MKDTTKAVKNTATNDVTSEVTTSTGASAEAKVQDNAKGKDKPKEQESKKQDSCYLVYEGQADAPSHAYDACNSRTCGGCSQCNGATNNIEVEISGPLAMFANVATRGSGECLSYDIPTYSALTSILGAIYWHPPFRWVIDELRVINPIRKTSHTFTQETICGNHTKSKGKNALHTYTYLKDVRYQLRAHIEWNYNHNEQVHERCYAKHLGIFWRNLDAPRRTPFLGHKECPVVVKRCKFGSGKGYYDTTPRVDMGFMFHSFTYADCAVIEEEQGYNTKNFWHPVMEFGVVKYTRPEACPKKVRFARGSVKYFQKRVAVKTEDNNGVKYVLEATPDLPKPEELGYTAVYKAFDGEVHYSK